MSDGLDLRIELFPSDLDAFVDFYTRVMRFEVQEDRRGADVGYVAVRRGGCRIGAVAAWDTVTPSARALPSGVEIVLEVEDREAEEEAVRTAGWPIEQAIATQPWGLRDFRLFDPTGYYLRVTTVAAPAD